MITPKSNQTEKGGPCKNVPLPTGCGTSSLISFHLSFKDLKKCICHTNDGPKRKTDHWTHINKNSSAIDKMSTEVWSCDGNRSSSQLHQKFEPDTSSPFHGVSRFATWRQGPPAYPYRTGSRHLYHVLMTTWPLAARRSPIRCWTTPFSRQPNPQRSLVSAPYQRIITLVSFALPTLTYLAKKKSYTHAHLL